MKKATILVMLLAAFLSLGLVAGCGGGGNPDSPFTNPGAGGPPNENQVFVGDGQFTAGPDAGKTISISISQEPSGDTTVLTATLIINRNYTDIVQLVGSYDASTDTYKMEGIDPKTGIDYTITGNAPNNTNSDYNLSGQATVTSSTGDSATVNVEK